MSDLEMLAAGVVATGFDGDAFDDALPRLGGYVLFARNCPSIAHVRALAGGLRARALGGAPPLIAIDQEGGRVLRLQRDVEPMPSMMALGATGDEELAGRAGEQAAFDLRRAGCTINLAPVLDLALDPANTVIGTRSLGADPHDVARLGLAYAAGLERGGMLSCYKHFPGHGGTSVDSHVALPSVDAPEPLLRARDLIPFARAARGARAFMGAHAVVTALDPDGPATTSRRIATGLLRGELGFSGALLSDCLQMGAVSGGAGSVAAGVAALDAGVDGLLVSDDPDLAAELVRAIVRAAERGELAPERLREAYTRVLALRSAAAPPLPLDAFAPHPGVGREIARRAITLIRGVPHADPVATCAVDFTATPERPDLSHEAPAMTVVRCELDPADDGAPLEAVERSKRRPVVLARRAHLHPGQARAIVRILERHPDAVVVSMLEPFDLPLFGAARHVLAAYGDDLASLGGLADVLFGGSRPQGRLPIALSVGV